MAFAYFYFDFNDEQKQLVRSLVCALIVQLSRRDSSVPDSLAALYFHCLDGQHKPTLSSLMNVLREISSSFSQTYIVLDALDECKEQEELLRLIGDITEWGIIGLHILATSRPEPMIKDHLATRIHDTVNLHNAPVDEDIRGHIRHQLQNDRRMSKWPLAIKEEIEISLMEGANGM
jgi:hypothetical protein